MKKSFLNFLIAIIFLLSIISNIQAEIKGKIIVKVGNKIITSYDLENEIKTQLFISKSKINQNNIKMRPRRWRAKMKHLTIGMFGYSS